jgi:hypothetical protein
VAQLFTRLRGLLPGAPALPGAPYRVNCVCGRELSGTRGRRPQTVRCPNCGRGALVLPVSVYPPVGSDGLVLPQPPRYPPWLGALVAAALTLTVVALVFVFVGLRLRRPEAPVTAEPASPAEQARSHLGLARSLLARGKFRSAADEAHAAAACRDQAPAALSPEEHRRLNQALREAELLDNLILLPGPLEALLAQAERTAADEQWQASFRRDYQGRAVLFYAPVTLDKKNRPALVDDRVKCAGATARVALDDLKALMSLPLEPGQRVLFGARLESFARAEDGGWVIRFAPDSGVLLTDIDALRQCRKDLSDDPDAPDVLRRQEALILAGEAGR